MVFIGKNPTKHSPLVPEDYPLSGESLKKKEQSR